MNRHFLFYGDSNTWGYRPGGGRLPANRRFTTMVTRQALDVFPVVDGLNGRCSAWESDVFPQELLGGASFVESLKSSNASQDGLDGLVIMLGTNDVMPPLNLTPETIAENLRRMVREAHAVCGSELVILIVSPPPLGPAAVEDYMETGQGNRDVLTVDLSAALKKMTVEENVLFLSGSSMIPHMDAEDGFHLAEVGHLRLGLAIGSLLRSIAATPQMPARRCCG